jgi:hypothetical protein
MRIRQYLLAACVLAPVCAGLPASGQTPGLPPSAALLLRYDSDMDGTITKPEMEAGLKADYEAADLDHNNCINAPELRAENDRRLKRDAGQASPLVDWNLDGCVNMAEFSGTVRSYFTFADRTKDGTVSTAELRGPAMPLPIPVDNARNNNQQQQQQQQRNPNAQPATPGISY